jgi:hypothetical protein
VALNGTGRGNAHNRNVSDSGRSARTISTVAAALFRHNPILVRILAYNKYLDDYRFVVSN